MKTKNTLARSFSVELAAYVADVSPEIIKRWMHGEGGLPVLASQEVLESTNLDFYDVIDIMHVSALRRQNISLQKIREAVEVARKTYNVQHPFAHKHQTCIFGNEIFIDIGDRSIQLTGSLKHQQAIKSIIEPFAKKIHHNRASGLAERFVALEKGKWRVELNATRGMGLPMVVPAYVSVATLIHAVKTEGSIANAAWTHDVPVDAVKIALSYDEERQSRREAA